MMKNKFLALLVMSFLHICYAGEKLMTPPKPTQEAIFAMGCFWCGAAAFTNHETDQKLRGVVEVKVGFAGGMSINPTYASHEGHQEVVKVVFDPKKISYAQLLDIFWHNIDPFDDNGQFCDRGSPYKASIFFQNTEQEKQAQASKEAVEKRLGKQVVTELKIATPFYDAEDYHQDYKIKNPYRYNFYRWNCGRDKRLKEIWNGSNVK